MTKSGKNKTRKSAKAGKGNPPVTSLDSTDTGDGKELKQAWGKPLRTIASLLIAFHLLAVFVAPFSGPPPSSIFGRGLGNLFSPYLRLTYIYHGYRFFAPNPGASHLIRYEVDTESETRQGIFPDRQAQWPRLLYHRHFMLSETIFNLNSALPTRQAFLVQQIELENEVTRLRKEGHGEMAERIEAARVADELDYDRYDRQQALLIEAIAAQLKSESNAREVRIYLAERRIPPPIVIEEAIEDRANGSEPAETRDQPILLIDPSWLLEQQIYPQLSTIEPINTPAPGGPVSSSADNGHNPKGRAGE